MTPSHQSNTKPSAAAVKLNAFKLTLNRFSRAVHAYLSAFAFITLIFFAVTGLLLNHPEWFAKADRPEEISEIVLDPAALDRLSIDVEPGEAIAAYLRQETRIIGQLSSADFFDDEVYLRFAGPRGQSDATVNLFSGESEIAVRRVGFIEFMNGLHRGRDSGAAWKLFIDISAILIFLLSLFGFILFFLIRFRRRTSLVLIGLSLLVIVGLPTFLVA